MDGHTVGDRYQSREGLTGNHGSSTKLDPAGGPGFWTGKFAVLDCGKKRELSNPATVGIRREVCRNDEPDNLCGSDAGNLEGTVTSPCSALLGR